MIPNSKEERVDFEIVEKRGKEWFKLGTETHVTNPKFDGTVARGSATCPCCGYTTPVESVRRQFKKRRGGADNAQLVTVREDNPKTGQRSYRYPTQNDLKAIAAAQKELEKNLIKPANELLIVPNEKLPPIGTLGFRVQRYGMFEWRDLFSSRQLLTLTTLAKYINVAGNKLADECDRCFVEAVQVCLSQALDRLTDFCTSLCVLNSTGGRGVKNTFGRQAISMVWDFMETNPFNTVGANWQGSIDVCGKTVETESQQSYIGQIEQADASQHPLADDIAQGFITDPPYYDAVPYADLSDFFYVWLRRTLPDSVKNKLFSRELTPKDKECVVDETKGHDKSYFEETMTRAMDEGRRVLAPNGIGIVVFAHKSTSGWETQLQAMVDAGWIMTGSWPIDTERPGRLRAQESAALASSVHLVCRPRENEDGSVRMDDIGDWREVLAELPGRIRVWMMRLQYEGIVGADAIFACLGPALEIFSRYSKVEKANGEQVQLREYLEQVWAAVSKEALDQVFKGANTSSFEEDARLTAMWLWTLGAGGNAKSEDAKDKGKVVASGGYTLEFDAARKIAQGLGAHLEQLTSLIEVKGDKARLLPVAERAAVLFGKGQMNVSGAPGKRKKPKQMTFADIPASQDTDEATWATAIEVSETAGLKAGQTTLDRVHQAMLLFAAGRSEAVRRFLVEDGIGADSRFWQLAQALSALYPPSSEERRWIDGLQARKKGLGF